MRMFRLLFFSFFLSQAALHAQTTSAPQLDADFHTDRRQAVRESLPSNSVSVFFSAPIRNRSNDVNYQYHQDPNFYYLTGFREAHAALLLFDAPIWIDGSRVQEVLFVHDRNAYDEQWEGTIMGVENAQKILGVEKVMSSKDFQTTLSSLQNLATILHLPFRNDTRDHPRKEFDLYSLQSAFTGFLHTQIKKDNTVVVDQTSLEQILAALREVKTEKELAILQQAVAMSVVGQVEVMRAIHPGMSERELQGIHEFVFKKYGAKHVGYPSIVGAGAHGCVLHYTANTADKVGNTLVLMDVGAEYEGYTADVTRTIPANGTYTKEQAAIYDLVLAAQKKGIEASVVGASFWDPGQAARKVIEQGLLELGIIQTPREARIYFPHGSSHYIGLDVHDPGTYGPLKANVVITVEPGIYIPPESDCDPKWWGIAVRIEDDILITPGGPVNLSAAAPRSIVEIEKMIKSDSPLDQFLLPPLDSVID